MVQCPSCSSYNDGHAAFCSQCGVPLEPRRSHSGEKHFLLRRKLSRARFLAPFILLMAMGAVVLIAYLPDQEERKEGRRASAPFRKSAPAPSQAVDSPEGEGAARLDQQPSAEELQTLDGPRVSKLVSQALVVLDLRSEEDRPLREERGVIVDSGGVVLCRFRPLLGAHHGTCRLPRLQEARVEITGVTFREEKLDLALVRIAYSPVGYPAVTLLADPPSQVLQPADPIFLIADDRAIESSIAENYFPCPDGAIRLRAAENPRVPAETFLATDSYGFILGLCRIAPASEENPRASEGYRVLIDPAQSLVKEVDREATLTLNEVTRRLYEGTFADYVGRGSKAFKQKRWGEAIELLEQALGRVSSDRPDEADVARVTADLRESYLEEIQRLSSLHRADEVVNLAQTAMARFAGDATLRVLLGEARYFQRNWAEGIQALVEARGLEPSSHVDSLLEEGYLQLAAEASQTGDNRAQEASLLEGIQQLPSSGALYLQLAKLYQRIGAYDDAIRLLQRVKEIAPALRDAAEGLLGKIDDALKQRDSVVIPITPGSRSIRAEGVIDGVRPHGFIIDTGATYTAISADLADVLGYDTTRSQRVSVNTVGGTLSVPMIQLQSLSVGGYSVRNLDVLVIPRNMGPESGLLGLNFLKHFKYSVDAREFRLERP